MPKNEDTNINDTKSTELAEGKAPLRQAQLIAVDVLAAGQSAVVAAKKAGVHRVTVAAWMKLPEFKAALMAACEERLAHAVPSLLGVLHKQATSNKANPFLRQNAARDLLDRAGFGRQAEGQPVSIVLEVSAAMPQLGMASEPAIDIVDVEYSAVDNDDEQS